jgi:hypothetical protein
MNDFKTELRELLNKYKATISWDCDEYSDLHGVYDEHMRVYDNKGNTLLKVSGNEINCYEIDLEKE